ncbi:MAG: tol-pal system-associated acyl-CoA thioesterase [Rhodobacterales bacterium]|nr:tol-pal system-associated acyl-CoA thioesterase [Rhodobacterales bacterium]
MPLRVYYEDTDAAGIVYYANYLKFAERARTDMLCALGYQHARMAKEQGLAFAVRHCAADYRRPALLEDRLEVDVTVTKAGGATLEVRQVVSRDGEALVVMDVRLACIDRRGRPARIPKVLRDILSEQQLAGGRD